VKYVIAVLGATGTGKSQLAIQLAVALGGEVVNADSMQLYRGMDIGTAKVTVAERHGVPHHLLDLLDVGQTASFAEFQILTRKAIDEIFARGRVPVLAGGSVLHVRIALDDLNFPDTHTGVRERLEAELSASGPAALHIRLSSLDPVTAAAILPSDGRRIVRALEVIELSGHAFSATLPGYDPGRPLVKIGLRLPRDELDRRITARVDHMWQSGFEAEVRNLPGLRTAKTARRAIGYRQMLHFLDGEWSAGQAREETVKATKRFAHHQEFWFRRDPGITWLDAAAEDLPTRALALVAARFGQGTCSP
jgi:tRNA dimethylallyltransferase